MPAAPPLRAVGRAAAPGITGPAVVIDVLRAFTTAAVAFDRGAAGIALVAGISAAHALRAEHPDWLLMGEEAGRPLAGFDFRNSPADLLAEDLTGRTLVQRTSSGTQGVAAAGNASVILCASLVCAAATATLLGRTAGFPTYVVSGWRGAGPGGPASSDGSEGDEDLACAELIAARLAGVPDPADIVVRVEESAAATRLRSDPVAASPHDLGLCTEIDRFGFAMQVERRDGLDWLTAVR